MGFVVVVVVDGGDDVGEEETTRHPKFNDARDLHPNRDCSDVTVTNPWSIFSSNAKRRAKNPYGK